MYIYPLTRNGTETDFKHEKENKPTRNRSVLYCNWYEIKQI